MTAFAEDEYIKILRNIKAFGDDVEDRTGVGTRMLTHQVINHDDVSLCFPLFMLKTVPFKSVAGELLWFLEGSMSDRRLAEITYGDGDRRTIWTANWEAKPYRRPTEAKFRAQDFNGPRNLGPIYGVQWRSWGSPNRQYREQDSKQIDQIADIIERAKKNPTDRRLIVNAWNPSALEQMSLPPCHMSFQINIVNDRLDLCWVQRSADMFLGVPFNVASYALLMHLIAAELGLRPRKLTGVLVNAHIYNNHMDQVTELIKRKDFSNEFYDLLWNYQHGVEVDMIGLNINKPHSLLLDHQDPYSVDDFTITGYKPLGTIKAEMAV